MSRFAHLAEAADLCEDGREAIGTNVMSEPEPIGAVLSQEACLARLWTVAQRHFPHVTEAKLIRYAHECIDRRDVQPFPDGGHFVRENLRDVALLLAAQLRDEVSVPIDSLGIGDDLICGYVLREIGVWLDDQREAQPPLLLLGLPVDWGVTT